MMKRIMKATDKSNSDDEERSYGATLHDREKQMESINNNGVSAHPSSIHDDQGYVEDWMMKKIERAVSSMQSVKSKEVAKKEPKFSIEDNPVFKAYKDGTLSTKNPISVPKPSVLGPYPGKDHFVGIWKVISNPMAVDDSNNMEKGNEKIILRVDGTTAAGPTLNLQTRQKAAGGTWKIFLQENGDVLLRIRLVIPPEKNRILVMEGLVERGSEIGVKLASRTFGIPKVEERANKANEKKFNILTCSGEVSLMKFHQFFDDRDCVSKLFSISVH